VRPFLGVRAKSYRVPSFLVLAIEYDVGHGLMAWYGLGIGLWAWLWWLSCNYSFGMGVGYVHGIWYYGLELWVMGYGRYIANGFSIAKVFSLVNELRIIK